MATNFLLGFLPQSWREQINAWSAQWTSTRTQLNNTVTTAVADFARDHGITLPAPQPPNPQTAQSQADQSTPTTPVTDPQNTTGPENAPPPVTQPYAQLATTIFGPPA